MSTQSQRDAIRARYPLGSRVVQFHELRPEQLAAVPAEWGAVVQNCVTLRGEVVGYADRADQTYCVIVKWAPTGPVTGLRLERATAITPYTDARTPPEPRRGRQKQAKIYYARGNPSHTAPDRAQFERDADAMALTGSNGEDDR